MCGLYGMINKFKSGHFNQLEIETFFEMGWVNSLRGRDSSSVWGIARARPEQYPREWKAIGDSSYLQFTKAGNGIEKFMSKDAVAVFGHGRRATVGKISLENQHPFRHKHIVLMHNGTISGGLDQKEKEVEVDSHALAIQVAEQGVETTLGKVEGAFAIIAYDLNKKRIIIARNYQRDLHYVEMTDMIFIMSEKKALEFVLDRMGRRNEVPKQFEPMKVYEIDPLDPSTTETKQLTKVYPPIVPFKHTYQADPIQDAVNGWIRNGNGVLVRDPNLEFKKRKIDDSTWAIKRGQVTRFVVEDCKKHDKSFRFWGVDLLGHNIVFFSGDPHPEWIDRFGFAPVVAAVPDRTDDEHKELTYIISPKEINWYKNWADLIEVERQQILAKLPCAICDQPFNEDDVNSLVIHKLAPLVVTHGDCEAGTLDQDRKLENEAHSHLPV